MPDATIANLRHLYQNMINGGVRDTASAKRIAEGLLAPVIVHLERRAQPAPAASPAPETADDLKEPKNGKQWRVEWWNESCRMMLPADKKLDSFQSYRNGTLIFTIKEQ